MARSSPVGDQILELYEVEEGAPAKRFTLRQLQDILNHLDPFSVKNALDRLRGQDGGIRRLRAVGYMSQLGHGGKPMPYLALGTAPDVPRTEEYIEDQAAEAQKRAKATRRRAEELRLKRELDAIDNYL
jgi:hypothetical protein